MKIRPILTSAAVLLTAAAWAWSAPPTGRFQVAQTGRQAAETEERAQIGPAPIGPAPRDKPDEAARKSHEAAVAVLRDARDRLLGQSLEAQIHQVVTIGERRFQAQGSYLQGEGLKLRLEYQIRVGDSVGTLLEVCDGQVLSTSTTIERLPLKKDGTAGDKQAADKSPAGAARGLEEAVEIEKTPQNTRVTRRDVGQILDAAARGDSVPRIMLLAELGLGGLPALLASLERSMTFETAKDQALEDGREFKVIHGTWNKESQQRWRAISGGGDDLPPYVPDAVRVYFDAENLFPQRILYLKRHPERKSLRPMVSLDFVQVKFNVSVSDADFDYEPPDGVNLEDVTNEYLKQMIPSGSGGG